MISQFPNYEGSRESLLFAIINFVWKPTNALPSDSQLVVLYAMVIFLTFGAVVYIFWPRGIRSVLSISVYLMALTSMKVAVKLVYVSCEFNFSKMVTAYHFLFCMLVALMILLRRSSIDGKPIPVPSSNEFWQAIFPIAISFGLSIASNNMALVFASVSFTEIIGAAGPIMSIPIVVAFGMPFNMRLLLPTCLVVGSCMLSMSGDVSFSALGVILCLLANIFRSLKAVLNQKVLTGDMRSRFEPVALLFWMCVPSYFMMLFWSFAVEGLQPALKFWTTSGWQKLALIAALVLSCINACILNLSQLLVTKDLGAIGVQLLAQMKSVLTVLSGMVVFKDTITVAEMIGFVGVLFGVWLHARWDSKLKLEQEASKTADQPKI